MTSSSRDTSPASDNTTSQQVHVPRIEISTADERTAVEAFVRRSVAVAGVVAVTSIVDDCRTARWQCLTDVQFHSPNRCDDVLGQSSVRSLTDLEHAQSAVCDHCHFDDADDDADNSSSSQPRSRLGRMLGRLTVRASRHTDRRKQPSPAQRCLSWSGCVRRVAIESSLSVLRSANRCRRDATIDSGDQVDSVEQERDLRPIQQFTTSLTSTDVRDGRFTARLPVDVMPRGDVMLRMRNGRLEVLHTDMSEAHRAPCRLYGVIELPMYIDTESVTVRHDPLQQCLVIEATTKGALRRRSMSLDELWWSRSRKRAHELGVRLIATCKRDEQHDHAVVLCSETRAVASCTISRDRDNYT